MPVCHDVAIVRYTVSTGPMLQAKFIVVFITLYQVPNSDAENHCKIIDARHWIVHKMLISLPQWTPICVTQAISKQQHAKIIAQSKEGWSRKWIHALSSEWQADNDVLYVHKYTYLTTQNMHANEVLLMQPPTAWDRWYMLGSLMSTDHSIH